MQQRNFIEKKEAGEKILSLCKTITSTKQSLLIGSFRGFEMKLSFQGKHFEITLEQANDYRIELGEDALGNITRINNAIDNIPRLLEKQKEKLQQIHSEVEKAKIEIEKPFLQEEELKQKSKRLAELNAELDMEQPRNSTSQSRQNSEKAEEKQENQKNFDTIAEPKQQNEIQSEVKKPSILTALNSFKPKENTTEIKKQKEVML